MNFLRIFIISVAILAIFSFGFEVFAQRYVPIEPLPGLPAGPTTLSVYLRFAYRAAIIFAAFLAVLMLVIGGIKYIAAAGDPGKLGDAKQTIYDALTGLFLVLLSYLILYTINPDFVNNAINIPQLNF